jgi:hypothetical protein
MIQKSRRILQICHGTSERKMGSLIHCKAYFRKTG